MHESRIQHQDRMMQKFELTDNNAYYECSLLAHSEHQGRFHLYAEHVHQVSVLASQFAEHAGLHYVASAAALLHDEGKKTDAFQEKLRTSSAGFVPHKGLGALIAATRGWFDVALAIAGHHGGIPAWQELASEIQRDDELAWQNRPDWKPLLDAAAEQSVSGLPNSIEPRPDADSRLTAFDVRVRLITSSLVDADFLDTEMHFHPKRTERRVPYPDIATLAKRFHLKQAELIEKADATPLNQHRRELYEASLKAAEQPPGFFRLALPTGAGKTRDSLGFAFRHAAHHGHRRIIVALPYTSIIDQMADEYRVIFGYRAFLEHHSDIQIAGDDPDDSPRQEEQRRRLAAENWDASLILTTTVQLFDSLFSNKPSKLRKVHRLANSILILDEIQTLPVLLLEPILDMLSELVERYGMTVVLSTATQPAFDRIKTMLPSDSVRDIIPDTQDIFHAFQRVSFDFPEEHWEEQQVVHELLSSPQAMVVVNTKADALRIYDTLRQKDCNALHLSTFMCPAHRRKVIREIRRRLKDNDPCRVVTTQLIEAGVDIDFPLVMRALGPLDRVIQAAGRCNREGKMRDAEGRPKRGRVVVFKLKDGKLPPGEYHTGTGIFEGMLAHGAFDPYDQAAISQYFRKLYENQPTDRGYVYKGKRRTGVAINPLRQKLDFPRVAEAFHLIEQGGQSAVAVGYCGNSPHRWHESEAGRLLERLLDPYANRRHLFRELQPYLVNVFENKLKEYRRSSLVAEHPSGILYWTGRYDDDAGIGRAEGDSEQLMI